MLVNQLYLALKILRYSKTNKNKHTNTRTYTRTHIHCFCDTRQAAVWILPSNPKNLIIFSQISIHYN